MEVYILVIELIVQPVVHKKFIALFFYFSLTMSVGVKNMIVEVVRSYFAIYSTQQKLLTWQTLT